MLTIHQILSAIRNKAFALLIIIFSLLFVTACNVDKNTSANTASNPKQALSFIPKSYTQATTPKVIKVAYPGDKGSALDHGMMHWKELAEELSYGTLKLQLYPNNALGDRDEIEKRIENGENIVTLSDSSLMYENGQKEVSVFSSPYLINNWDEAQRLTSGQWYKRQIDNLLKTRGIRVISKNWHIGIRHILSTIPIVKAQELSYLKIAVPDDTISYAALKYMGSMPITIVDNREINSSFKSKKINAVEDTINNIFDNKYYENAKYLLLSAHMYKMGNIIINEKVWRSLDNTQKHALEKSCEHAAEFYNIVQNAAEIDTLKQLAAAGVTITTPNAQYARVINRITKDFVKESKMSYTWTPQLYSELGRLKQVRKPIKLSQNNR